MANTLDTLLSWQTTFTRVSKTFLKKRLILYTYVCLSRVNWVLVMCQLHEEITRDRKTQCLHRFVKEQTAGLPPQNSTITAVLRFVLRSVCKPLKFIGTTTLSIRRVPKTTASPSSSSSFFSLNYSRLLRGIYLVRW